MSQAGFGACPRCRQSVGLCLATPPSSRPFRSPGHPAALPNPTSYRVSVGAGLRAGVGQALAGPPVISLPRPQCPHLCGGLSGTRPSHLPFPLGCFEHQVGIMVSVSRGMLSVSGREGGVSWHKGAGRDLLVQACCWPARLLLGPGRELTLV